jgi:hypothetical protein
MNKIVRIGVSETLQVYCRIELSNNGRLSISGVEGPMPSGNCRGSCGQLIMSYKEYDTRGYKSVADIKPAPGWNAETIKRFFDIWDRWHLNDMRAGCEHQRGAEWESREVTLYHFTLTEQASKDKKAAEQCALDALRRGEIFKPTAQQTELAVLPYEVTHHEPHLPARGQFYQPRNRGATEKKNTNWLKPSEHPAGLLCKPCPVCGYKYGTAWKREEVPADVIAFLQSLPDTDIKPAWV